ncbi:hypothetical protein ABPG74_001033 [Tetrahymena malaccensis]
MKGTKFFLQLTLLLAVSLVAFNSYLLYRESKYVMSSTGIPSKVFGPYVFIYDGVFDERNQLKGGIPQWVIEGGSNIAILSFLDPVELEKSNVPPQQFLESIAQVSSNSNYYVMFSVGGWDFQNRFTQTNPQTVAQNAAYMAKKYNIGFEIDCEADSGAAKEWINSFIKAYRQIIPKDDVNFYSVLTMDTGASPGAFFNVEAAALENLDSLNWVNAMVYDPELSPDNRQFWDYHKIPPNQFTVARNLVNTCDDLQNLLPTLSYQKDGQPIRGILFWAALSGATCDSAQEGAHNCGTSCVDCTGGVGTKGNWSCPAVASACKTYGACN